MDKKNLVSDFSAAFRQKEVSLDEISFEEDFAPDFSKQNEESDADFDEAFAKNFEEDTVSNSSKQNEEKDTNFEEAFAKNFEEEPEKTDSSPSSSADLHNFTEDIKPSPPPIYEGEINLEKTSNAEADEFIANIESFKKSGFFRRAFAHTADNIVQVIILYIFIFAGFAAMSKGVAERGEQLSLEHLENLLLPITLLAYLINAGYYIFFHWATGQTPGKMLFKIRVVGTDGHSLSLMKSFLRWIGYYLSTIPLMLGFLMIFFTRQKQALHDKVAGTYVIDLKGLAG